MLSYDVFSLKFCIILCTLKANFLFQKHNTSLCIFCNVVDETVIFLFIHYSKTKPLCCTINDYFKRNLHIPLLLPQSPIFCFLETNGKVFLKLVDLLWLFKYYVYVARSSKVLSFQPLLKSIIKVRKPEKTLSQSGERKRKLFTGKWKTVQQNL